MWDNIHCREKLKLTHSTQFNNTFKLFGLGLNIKSYSQKAKVEVKSWVFGVKDKVKLHIFYASSRRFQSHQIHDSDSCLSHVTWIYTSDFLYLSLPKCKTYLFFLIPGFPGQTSCRDTGDPTRGSSPTSVPCVRRSSHAVTTFQNTSKSTVSHEAAGQFAQQTDVPLGSLGMLGSLSYRHRPREQGVSVYVQVCA